jgi:hypothetical protein
MSDNGNTNSRSLTPKSFYFVIEPKVWKLTRCDDNQIIIYTGTNLADYAGKIVKLSDDYCYSVTKHTGELPANVVAVTVVGDPYDSCNSCATYQYYTLTRHICNCGSGALTVYTLNDMSYAVGKYVYLEDGNCYLVSGPTSGTLGSSITVSESLEVYDTAVLCCPEVSCGSSTSQLVAIVTTPCRVITLDQTSSSSFGVACTDANGYYNVVVNNHSYPTDFGAPNAPLICGYASIYSTTTWDGDYATWAGLVIYIFVCPSTGVCAWSLGWMHSEDYCSNVVWDRWRNSGTGLISGGIGSGTGNFTCNNETGELIGSASLDATFRWSRYVPYSPSATLEDIAQTIEFSLVPA